MRQIDKRHTFDTKNLIALSMLVPSFADVSNRAMNPVSLRNVGQSSSPVSSELLSIKSH